MKTSTVVLIILNLILLIGGAVFIYSFANQNLIETGDFLFQTVCEHCEFNSETQEFKPSGYVMFEGKTDEESDKNIQKFLNSAPSSEASVYALVEEGGYEMFLINSDTLTSHMCKRITELRSDDLSLICEKLVTR